MAIQVEQHQFKGIQRDLTRSKFSPEFMYDAKNIRITAREDNTTLSVTNEKGTKNIEVIKGNNPYIIEGDIIGYNTLNDYLILFTTSLVDRIYRLEYKDNIFEAVVLFEGALGFNSKNPIESICVYENNNIQKVYWVDGINQPRVINITAPEDIRNKWTSNSFEFVQNLNLREIVTVKRTDSSNGVFSPGIIQYSFTYYNKYGQESNIFYTTPLQYISFSDRGGTPENKISNSFSLNIKNIDTRFDFIRIYSLHRTSIDSTPSVYRVVDLPITDSDEISYIDNGNNKETIDPTELLYIGGESVIAKTITQKDNTLFLGNIELSRPSISKTIKDNIRITDTSNSNLLKTILRTITGTVNYNDAYYKYTNSLNSGNTAGFKAGEHYRLGVQFQYQTGKWSEPVFIGDYNVSDSVRPESYNIEDSNILKVPKIEFNLDSSITRVLKEQGFKRVRPLVVFPSLQERKIITQGMLCPTVFNIGNRRNNTPFSQSSWFLRPFLPWDVDFSNPKMNNNSEIDKGAWVEFRHHYGIFNGANRGAEIQNISQMTYGEYNLSSVNNPDTYSSLFMIDQSIVTMHSPDIEFDTSIQNLDYRDLQVRIVGAINFTSSIGDIDIQTSSPVAHPTKATGFKHRTLGVKGPSDLAARSLVSGLFYNDWLIDDKSSEKYNYYDKEEEEVAWLVYPWQKSGSINNDINVSNRAKSSVLSKKKMSNLKYSSFNTWFSTRNYWQSERNDSIHNGITSVQLFNSNELNLVKLKTPSNSALSSVNYYGNVDTLLPSVNSYNLYFTGALKGNSKWVTPSFYDTQFNTISVDVKELGDYNDNLKYSKDPVRMKYKSSPHIVFGLNYTTESASQVILPTTYGSKGSGVNIITESVKPFWIDKITAPSSGSFYTLKYVWRNVNVDPGTTIPPIEWVDGDYYYDAYNSVLYRYNSYSTTEFPFEVVKRRELILSQDFKYKDTGSLITYYYRIVGADNSVSDVASVVLEEYYSSLSEDYEFSVKQDVISEYVQYPYLFLAELYRKNIINAFGGTSEDAIKNNLWIPAGESTYLCNNGNIIEFKYGDTWYQRYDCLKTYPYTLEDENSIVEIGSFMCETRVNIDGRYDRNRGQVSNLTMTPNNFNLYNEVYSQKDNFFNYRILDEDYYNINKFTNVITWTKEKSLGSSIDTWTNITMASTLDLDGDKGEITSLNTYNNEIYCFQKNGFSNILFNSRVQIPTSDGVPIEITNGLKVQGKRYIDNYIGCSNKWSIAESPAGIYFIDDNTNSLYLYNGKINSLSSTLGLSNWVKENITNEKWNPSDFNSFICYYDNSNKDLYIVNKKECLCYSEQIHQFTSFMSYESVYPFFNIKNKLFSIKNNKLWENFEGDYNMFYDEFKPYYVTFIANSNPNTDKIFNNIEFRADSWNGNNLLNNNTFDTLEVWNEYQEGSTCLDFNMGVSPLKKKFRIWRANIPRANCNKRDRIRNTWAFIKLAMNNRNTWKTEFHDASVYYFM